MTLPSMLATDFVLYVCLAAFAALWLVIGPQRARVWLWILALAALASGLSSVMQSHWQATGGVVLAGLSVAVLALLGVFKATERWSSKRRRSWLGGVMATLVVLAALPLYLVPLFSLPKPVGPHTVGTRQFELTDPSRTDRLDGGGSGPHRLQVRAWYPAASSEGFAARRYFSGTDLPVQPKSVARNFGMPSFFFTHLALVRTHSFEGAPVASEGERFPVVIFNHGFYSYLAQNTVLMEHLASHGYIVFSIAHPLDGAAVEFTNGDSIHPSKDRDNGAIFNKALPSLVGGDTHEVRYAGLKQLKEGIGAMWLTPTIDAWREDNLFLARSLEHDRQDAAVAKLVARADFDKLAYAGMSFGGATAATVCEVDERCKAAVDLDGFNWDMSLYDRSLRAPLLFVQSDWMNHDAFEDQHGRPKDPNFYPSDYAYEAWTQAGDRADIHRFRMSQLAHMGLSDMILAVRPPLRTKLCGRMEPRTALGAVNDLTLGFLERYLQQRNADFPRNVVARYPDVIPHDASAVKAWWTSRKASQ